MPHLPPALLRGATATGATSAAGRTGAATSHGSSTSSCCTLWEAGAGTQRGTLVQLGRLLSSYYSYHNGTPAGRTLCAHGTDIVMAE
eukprot:1931355-Lingulodinium_polyedra.AAC.1